METQSQKYNGNNCWNNRVTIDYKKRKVTFKPVKGNWTIKKTRRALICGAFQAYLYITIILGAPIVLVANSKTDGTEQMVLITMLAASITTATLGATIMYLKSRNRKWMKDRYPKVNATILKVVTMGAITKRRTIKPGETYKNIMVIPDYGNIELKYKLEGDFKKVKKIAVRENDKRGNRWHCIFEFEKEPKTGKMQITYT